MKKILAIAAISVRTAVRSKVILSLVAILVLIIVGLPLTIKGDGTVTGHAQVLITYTLSMVTFILSLSTLWAACAAVSMDVMERQIHMVVTKPVRRIQIWAGKWLGLIVLNAFLLGISGLTIYGLLRWTTGKADIESEAITILEEEVLTARLRVGPTFPDVRSEARRHVLERRKAGDLPEGISIENAVAATAQGILIRANSVPRGASLSWIFHLPITVRAGETIHFRYSFSNSDMSLSRVTGAWRFGGPDAMEQVQRSRDDTAEGFHSFRLPSSVVSPDGSVLVQFLNANAVPVAVLFPPADGLALYVPAGTFEGNLFRLLLITLFHLAFLAAVGVTAGSLFSMPVAAFASFYMVVVLKFIPYIQSMANRETILTSTAPGAERSFVLLDWFIKIFFQAMDFVVSPLQTRNPLEALGTGEMVPWNLVGYVFIVKVVVYGGLVAVIGGWLFNRRELGLPS